MIQKEIRELPVQSVIYNDDLFALDSEETNQTGKITYQQLLDRIREDVFKEVQKIIDAGEQPVDEHDQQQDATIVEMNTALLNICDKVYPIGSIYITLGTDNPSTLFGGTWERIEDRFLLAKGSTYTELGHFDGAAEVTLSAAQSGCPAHTHPFTRPTVKSSGACNTGDAGGHKHWIAGDNDTVKSGNSYMRPKGNGNGKTANAYDTSTNGSHAHSVPNHTHTLDGGSVGAQTAVGASAAHNNMPPYVIVNVWKRVEDPVGS